MAGILHQNINVMLENSKPSHIEGVDNEDGYDISDKGGNFNIEDGESVNGNDTGVEYYYDNNFFGSYWDWNHWTPIVDDDAVSVPPINDSYNGRNGLKPRDVTYFDTIILCVFKFTAMNF